jgi:DNA-binding GntR family transcriptional regulator
MGAQLHIDELCQKLGTSRTPIREALLRLEKDGLVRAVPRVGYFVTLVTRKDLKELFEIRQMLEGHAVATATPNLTASDLDHLEQVLADSAAAVEAADTDKFLRLEIEFHTYLMNRAPNRHLSLVMETLRDLTYRERVLSMQSADNLRHTLVEHGRVLGHLRERDGKSAGEMMSKHIGDALVRMLQFLDLAEGENGTSNTSKKEE